MFKQRDNDRREMVPRTPALRRRKLEPGEPALDYKDMETLRKFITTSSKLMSRKRTGMTAQEQSDLKNAIKHARFMALLPYTGAHN